MQTIITAFEKFMGQNGKFYGEFYVGIATDPVDRLTNGHQVSSTTPHIYTTQPMSSSDVRIIEKHFLAKGTKGGPGGGDNGTCHIYAYKVSPSTRE